MLPTVPEPCQGSFPPPRGALSPVSPLPAPLFPSFNPLPCTPPTSLPRATFLESPWSAPATATRATVTAKLQSSPSLMALRGGTAAQLRLSPTWTLAPDVSGRGCSRVPSLASSHPPRSMGASCGHRTPGSTRDPGGAGGTGSAVASGQGMGQRPLCYPKGWAGMEEPSRQRCLGAPPPPLPPLFILPAAPGFPGSWARSGSRRQGSPGLPKNICGGRDVSATGRGKWSSARGIGEGTDRDEHARHHGGRGSVKEEPRVRGRGHRGVGRDERKRGSPVKRLQGGARNQGRGGSWRTRAAASARNVEELRKYITVRRPRCIQSKAVYSEISGLPGQSSASPMKSRLQRVRLPQRCDCSWATSAQRREASGRIRTPQAGKFHLG